MDLIRYYISQMAFICSSLQKDFTFEDLFKTKRSPEKVVYLAIKQHTRQCNHSFTFDFYTQDANEPFGREFNSSTVLQLESFACAPRTTVTITELDALHIQTATTCSSVF